VKTFRWPAVIMFVALIISTPVVSNAITYNQALQMAFRNNPGLSIADLGVAESEQKLTEAKSSFHPSVKFSASYTRLGTVPMKKVEVAPGVKLDLPMGAADNYKAGFAINAPIFLGGKRLFGLEMAELGVDAAVEKAMTSRADLHSKVTTAFYGLMLAEESERIARLNLSRTQEQLKETKARWKVGYASPLDLKQDQVALSQAKAALVQAKNKTLRARQFLNMVIGRPLSDSVSAQGSLDVKYEKLSVDSLVERALDIRPEVSALGRAAKIAKLSLDMARSSYSPSVVFIGSPSWSNPDQASGEGWGSSMAATIALEWPLYDGGKGLAKARAAEIQLKKFKYSKLQAVDGIELEVRQAYASWEEAAQQLMVQQNLGAQMAELASMATEQYKMGVISSMDYQKVMLSKTQVELANLASRYQMILAKEKLVAAAWLWDAKTLEEFKKPASNNGKED